MVSHLYWSSKWLSRYTRRNDTTWTATTHQEVEEECKICFLWFTDLISCWCQLLKSPCKLWIWNWLQPQQPKNPILSLWHKPRLSHLAIPSKQQSCKSSKIPDHKDSLWNASGSDCNANFMIISNMPMKQGALDQSPLQKNLKPKPFFCAISVEQSMHIHH